MTPEILNVLVIDDSRLDVLMISKFLADKPSRTVKFSIDTAMSISEAVEHITSKDYDIILLDLHLPDSDGVESVDKIRKETLTTPVVVLTGQNDDKTGLQTIEKGAEDYLVKGDFSSEELIKTIRYAIERSRTEKRIKNAAEQWRTTFDSITDLVSIHDKNFKVLRVNKAFADACNMSPKELIGKYCFEVVHGTKKKHDPCPNQEVWETKLPATQEFFEPRLDKFLEVSVSPVLDEKGQVVATVHIAKDISERKRIEQERKEHDYLKSEFIATVSHEMRTPLTIFKNIISNALAGVMGKISPKLQDNLERADKTIDRLARIVSDFLDMSKIEAGKMKLNITQFDIQSTISNVVKNLIPLAEQKNLNLRTCVNNSQLLVNADHDAITRVLINLINNAIKFTPEGGWIEVRAKSLGEKIAVEVEDNGFGIAAEDLDKIFDRFVQVEKHVGPGEHGTGLGLPIAKELVEIHGGKIDVVSKLGKGATFTVLLPVVGPQSNGTALTADDKNKEKTQQKETAQFCATSLKSTSVQ